ncbi:MAG: 50S ribosomal protein L4 [Candidatus Bathyarchaeota archaeon]|jgi:large subunit ribosomal protein L4e
MGKRAAKIFNLEGKSKDKISLPAVFKTPIRPDVIKRAVVALQSHRFQPQGRNPLAGKRRSVESLGAGHGMARVPRIKGMGRRAGYVPGTVGGREAHPPKAEKKIVKRIPKKEMKLALRSAVAATASKEIVASRGHITDYVPDFPLVVMDDIQKLEKTSEMKETLIKLGVWPDIYRVEESQKIRAGKGKMRGRKRKHAVGPLLVVAENTSVLKAARNILGMDTVKISNLNVELLAPGTHPGRLTLWSKSAFEKLEELFGD